MLVTYQDCWGNVTLVTYQDCWGSVTLGYRKLFLGLLPIVTGQLLWAGQNKEDAAVLGQPKSPPMPSLGHIQVTFKKNSKTNIDKMLSAAP